MNEDLKNVSILIVDDEPGNIKILAELLQADYNVMVSNNGEKALRLALSDKKPDLILLDVMMPDMDGYEVCKLLKSNEKTDNIPVIFITGKVSEENELKGFNVGAVDYITKPFSPVVVKSRVKTHLLLKQALEKQKKHIQEIKIEKHNYAHLLNSLFPSMLVDELLQTGDSIPTKNYANVAVLIVDIDDFKTYCKDHKPKEVIEELQKFSQICEVIAPKHNVQKIKAEEESFLAVSGMISESPNPVFDCVSCAIELINQTKNLPSHWKLRIGIHLGVVIGGIVEKRQQYLFDIWGDCVTTALQMKQMATPNCLFLTESAWQQIKILSSKNLAGKTQFKTNEIDDVFEVTEKEMGVVIHVDK